MRRSGLDNVGPNRVNAMARNAQKGGFLQYEGLYIGKVIEIVNDRYEGYLYVELVGQQQLSDPFKKDERKNYVRCRRAVPYGGSYQGEDHTRTYGMSVHPPAPGTEVLVAFTGKEQEGIVIGVLPDAGRNASYPDHATSYIDGENNTVGASYDHRVNKRQAKNERKRHEIAGQIAKQGLGLDSVRGLSSSSARRESPSNVFGFNTPSGHSLVLDDGTVKPSERSLAPDTNRQEGQSNLIRLRSAGGAQMLFNDTSGIVYVINQAGNSWVQLSADGKIDIYSSGDISMHTENDLNFHVGGDFALDADSINLKARGSDGCKVETATGEFNLHSNKDLKLTTDLNLHFKASGNSRTTAALIDLNGPEATEATKTTNNNISVNRTVKQSITGRVPEAEPWGGHKEEQGPVPVAASSNIDHKGTDIDVSNVSNPGSSANTTKSQTTQVGAYAVKSNNVNPRSGKAYPR